MKLKYGIIGHPVKHSLSPAMQNAAFEALGIDAEYLLYDVEPKRLETFLKNAKANNISGLNITIPYKEKVLDFVTLDPDTLFLKQVKAVNTIVRSDDKWQGYNTDIFGFQKHLKEQFDPAAKKTAILGAGGACRAVAYALAVSKAQSIDIFDIDKEKAQNLVAMVKSLFPEFAISGVNSIEELDIRNKDLLVNCTPVGMKEADPCLVKDEMLHKDLFVYDLIYNPAKTKLLAKAEEKGAKISNGLGMLLYQGALAFTYFTGEIPPVKVMEDALKEGVKNL